MSEEGNHSQSAEKSAVLSGGVGLGPQALPKAETLAELVEARMPFGKYQGRRLLELPEAYLLWFQRQGFPKSKLGDQMLWTLELKAAGLMPIVRPLMKSARLARPADVEPPAK